MCLGAGLAPSETFLFFTAIPQWFHALPMGSLANTHLTPECTGLGNVPQPSSSAWWSTEVRLSHPPLTLSDLLIPLVDKGPELQMEASP